MRLRTNLSWIIVILSTTFVFFQAAGIIKIDYLLITMFMLCLILILYRGKIVFDKSILLYVVIITLMTLSIFYTVNQTLTTIYLLAMLFGLILLIALMSEKETPNIVNKTILCFSLINVYITLVTAIIPETKAVISLILPNVNTNFKYASGILGQTGSNAYVISFSIVYMATKLIGSNKNRCSTILFLISGALALILTGKRGPLIWVCITIMIIDILHYNKSQRKNIFRRIALYIIVILCAITFLSIIDNITLVSESLARFSDPTGISSPHGRIVLYRRAMEIIGSNLIFGIGAGAYNYFGMGVHNDYLQILAENGLLCATLYYVMLIVNLKIAIKEYNKSTDNIMLYMIGMQVYMMLNALAGTSFLHYGFYFIYLLICASCTSIIKRDAYKLVNTAEYSTANNQMMKNEKHENGKYIISIKYK